MRTVNRVAPVPLVPSVTVAGRRAVRDRLPGRTGIRRCDVSDLTFDTTDGLWKGTWTVPAGTYAWKVAINNSWDVNYGAGGAAGGSDIALVVPAGGASVTFVWDQVTTSRPRRSADRRFPGRMGTGSLHRKLPVERASFRCAD